MLTASYVINSLKLIQPIPKHTLKRANENYLFIGGLCAGTTENEVFLANSSSDSNVVRMFNVDAAKLDVVDSYQPPNEERVGDVAYSVMSETLFVVTWNQERIGVAVRSFARVNYEWRCCCILQLKEAKGRSLFLRVLPDDSLFCSMQKTDGVHVCRVQADRSIEHCSRVTLPCQHMGIDAQLVANEKRLTAALVNGTVALFRVDENQVIHLLSQILLPRAQYPLFIGDNLLVGVASNEDFSVQVAESFFTTGGILKYDRKLIPRIDRLDIYRWCFQDISRTLYLWNFKSKELLVYKAD